MHEIRVPNYKPQKVNSDLAQCVARLIKADRNYDLHQTRVALAQDDVSLDSMVKQIRFQIEFPDMNRYAFDENETFLGYFSGTKFHATKMQAGKVI